MKLTTRSNDFVARSDTSVLIELSYELIRSWDSKLVLSGSVIEDVYFFYSVSAVDSINLEFF